MLALSWKALTFSRERFFPCSRTKGIKREIIPELLQSECNAKEIFKSTVYFLKNPKFAQNQVEECLKTLDKIRPASSSSDEAAKVLNKYLIS